MTCQHCCGAEKIFDIKDAKKQLKRYRKKGPRKATSRLIQAIKAVNNPASSLLDIGGGIGAIQLELIKNGVDTVTSVDASSSYIEMAKTESERQNVSDKINYIQGDFLDNVDDIKQHDIVVLDKVICCYPYMTDLLDASLSKSKKILGVVYPKSNTVTKIIFFLGNTALKLSRNPFRAYLHSNEKIKNKIEKAGFELNSYKSFFLWNIEVYERSI